MSRHTLAKPTSTPSCRAGPARSQARSSWMRASLNWKPSTASRIAWSAPVRSWRSASFPTSKRALPPTLPTSGSRSMASRRCADGSVGWTEIAVDAADHGHAVLVEEAHGDDGACLAVSDQARLQRQRTLMDIVRVEASWMLRTSRLTSLPSASRITSSNLLSPSCTCTPRQLLGEGRRCALR